MVKTIFVQIASYRDPELKNTIKSCIDSAKHPENLRFCIAWQHGDDENLDEYQNDKRFNIISIPYKESKGACWARNLIQQYYNNEQYTLQLDSHHRFAQDWDLKLINMYENLKSNGHKKPLITGYIPSYDPAKDPESRDLSAWKMNFDKFAPEGMVLFLPAVIDNFQYYGRPVRARFYSAHFAFAGGGFAQEVQHDPEYYFHGEEISISARAFTHGYDLFHPTEVIAWHEYTRNGRVKHWDDDNEWYIKNTACHKKNRELFGVDGEGSKNDYGKYGFGTERTLRDYEVFAGICFANRSVSEQVLANLEPDNFTGSLTENEYHEWKKSLTRMLKVCIEIPKSNISKDIDYDFWYIGFSNKEGKEIFRQDMSSNEIKNLLEISAEHNSFTICKQFNIVETPFKWTVWPHSKNGGWMTAMHGDI
jgi:hypothetical protein